MISVRRKAIIITTIWQHDKTMNRWRDCALIYNTSTNTQEHSLQLPLSKYHFITFYLHAAAHKWRREPCPVDVSVTWQQRSSAGVSFTHWRHVHRSSRGPVPDVSRLLADSSAQCSVPAAAHTRYCASSVHSALYCVTRRHNQCHATLPVHVSSRVYIYQLGAAGFGFEGRSCQLKAL